MKRFNYYSLLFLLIAGLISCNKLDPAEEVPSYIYIEEITIENDYSTYGSSSNSAIADAWVYLGNELIGAFELPANIPILSSGEKSLKIYAGVKRNGISGNRVKYPMLDPYSIDVTLIQDKSITINPVVSYNPNVNVWFEDFEDATIELFNSNQHDVPLEISSTVFAEGLASGAGIFGNSGTLFEIETDNADFNNLTSNNFVYMELDYATNHDLVVGINYTRANETPVELGYLTLVPTFETDVTWNKIYIDLSEVIQPNAPYEDLDIFIGSQKTNETFNPQIYIDNVKIVTW